MVYGMALVYCYTIDWISVGFPSICVWFNATWNDWLLNNWTWHCHITHISHSRIQCHHTPFTSASPSTQLILLPIVQQNTIWHPPVPISSHFSCMQLSMPHPNSIHFHTLKSVFLYLILTLCFCTLSLHSYCCFTGFWLEIANAVQLRSIR